MTQPDILVGAAVMLYDLITPSCPAPPETADERESNTLWKSQTESPSSFRL
jgi:hypothetical protein